MKVKVFLLFFLINIFYYSSSKNTSNANSSFILAKINNEIITNIDVKNEKYYLLAINKNLLELNSERLFEVSKNSLIREKIKINELSKYYDLDEEVSYLDEILKDFYTNLKLENEEQLKIYFFENNVNLKDVKKKTKYRVSLE